jgi:hypothetical protein
VFDAETEQMQIVDRLHNVGDYYKARIKKYKKREDWFLRGSFFFMFPSLIIPYTPIKLGALVLQLVALSGFLYYSRKGLKMSKEWHDSMEKDQEYIQATYE